MRLIIIIMVIPVTYVYDGQDDVLLHGVQGDPEQGEHQQLHGADLPQHRPVGDQAAGHAEVGVDQAGSRGQRARRVKCLYCNVVISESSTRPSTGEAVFGVFNGTDAQCRSFSDIAVVKECFFYR